MTIPTKAKLRFVGDNNKGKKEFVILSVTKGILRAIYKRSCPVAEDFTLCSRMTKRKSICHPERNEGSSTPDCNRSYPVIEYPSLCSRMTKRKSICHLERNEGSSTRHRKRLCPGLEDPSLRSG